MIPRIVEVSRDHTGNVYVLVEFRERRNGPVVLIEEFIMQIPETLIDPSTQLPVPVDARAVMVDNIRRYVELATARNWRGDRTEGPEGVSTRQRDATDTRGVVGRLKADVGSDVTVSVRP